MFNNVHEEMCKYWPLFSVGMRFFKISFSWPTLEQVQKWLGEHIAYFQLIIFKMYPLNYTIAHYIYYYEVLFNFFSQIPELIL